MEPDQETGCVGSMGIMPYGTSIIMSGDGGQIFSFDQPTGAVQWVAPRLVIADVPSLSFGDQRPVALSGRTVVAGSTSGYITAYDAGTGQQLWQVNPKLGSASRFPLASDERQVYVRFLGGQLAAFDVATGGEAWRMYRPTFLNSPAVASNRLYVGGAAGLYALRK